MLKRREGFFEEKVILKRWAGCREGFKRREGLVVEKDWLKRDLVAEKDWLRRDLQL